MRLLLGEPGSGKSTAILNEVRRHLAAQRGDFRLIVPTATMAEHVRNSLAREGLGVRGSTIVTLAGFVESLRPKRRLASGVAVSLFLRQILADRPPRAFAALAGSPGFAPALASALEDLANAGCDALQWAALGGLGVHTGPLSRAIQDVYEQLEQRLAGRGLAFRAQQLIAAAAQARSAGTARTVYFDGFFSFSRAEIELIRALKQQADVTVALPEWPGAVASRDALRQMGLREQRLTPVRPRPEVTLVSAGSREREVEEIALRLLEQHQGGRPWREMGVVTRSAQPYAALLETVCARLGIPLRAYFAAPLAAHPVCRFTTLLVEAAISGWEWRKTAEALRAAVSVTGGAAEADAWALKVREALPGSGLSDLMERLGLPSELGSMESWTAETATAAEWAARMGQLAAWVAPPEPGGGPEALRIWQARGAALRSMQSTLAELAALLGDEPMLLEGFWREAHEALRAVSLRVADGRREAVHLLDVYEARQWELPVVFVCGLLEGEFPRAARPDPVLSEDTRIRLRANGIPVATRGERQQEEEFLYRFAQTRATAALVLSWPEHDAEGRPQLRSFALDERSEAPVAARALRVRPWRRVAAAPQPALQSTAALERVRRRHPLHRPTALESFLQCPFQFFAGRTLELKEAPAWPHERLDALAQGNVIHEVVSDWHRGQGSLDELLERHWNAMLVKLRIPPSHRVEVARLLMERSLKFYAENARILPGWRVETERPLEIEIEGVLVKGRADRLDVAPDRAAIVYDFKFSGASGIQRRLKQLEAGLTVQGGLYLAAARGEGLRPAGFVYVGLRGDTTYEEFLQPDDVQALMDRAVEAAGQSILRIAAGAIEVRPADLDACRYCAFAHACRIQSAGRAEAATG